MDEGGLRSAVSGPLHQTSQAAQNLLLFRFQGSATDNELLSHWFQFAPCPLSRVAPLAAEFCHERFSRSLHCEAMHVVVPILMKYAMPTVTAQQFPIEASHRGLGIQFDA